jgi:hypothetical protein
MKFLFLWMLLVSCSSFEEQAQLGEVIYNVGKVFPFTKNYRRIDDELKPYIKDFEDFYKVRIDFRVKFASQHDQDAMLDAAAVCEFDYLAASKSIMINRDAWNTLTEPTRLAIIYHELGHCVYFRDHRETLMPDTKDTPFDQVPDSLMFPYVSPEWDPIYIEYWDYYREELRKLNR